MSERSLGGHTLSGSERPSQVVRQGPDVPGAGLRDQASMYNSGKYCYRHEPMAVPRTAGKKIA